MDAGEQERIVGFLGGGPLDPYDCGHYHVVDYKTSKSPSYLTPFQLYVYGLVVKKDFPDAEKITGSYNLLKHDCKYKSMTK